MYSFIYFLMSLLGAIFLYDKKYSSYYQKICSLILAHLLFIFFLFNNISPDKSYYGKILSQNYFSGFNNQGYDIFYYYFIHLISLTKNPHLANTILYFCLIYSVYFFSNKFKNTFHIILLFFPFIFVVVMQGYPRQAWALIFIIMGSNLIFYLNKNNKNGISNEILKIFFIFCIFLVALFFHYSAIIFIGIYVLFLLKKLQILKKIRLEYIILTIFYFSIIIWLLYSYSFIEIYLIKLQQIKEFFSTRIEYSPYGAILRSIPIVTSSILIILFFIKNRHNKEINFNNIDEFFLISSLVYIVLLLFFLFTPELIIIFDRLSIYFFLITVYFLGRFIFFPFLRRVSNYFILFSIFYLNLYLLFWSTFSKSYYEFKYNFDLFSNNTITILTN